MRSVKPAILLLFACVVSLSFVACGSGGVPQTVNPLVISTRTLTLGVINSSYTATLVASGGLAPFTWSITTGSLPSGLSMSAGGVISGTPTVTGSFPITVQVTDSQTPTAAVATAGFTMTVNEKLSITTTTLDVASVGIGYSATLLATGGVPAYRWSLASGTLPDGLTLSPLGIIAGTPTTEQTSVFTVTVTDSENPAVAVSQDLSLTVGGPVSRISGHYAFFLRGFKNGLLQLQAGSFVSDGQGNITSGVSDIVTNTGAGVGGVKVPLHGTYTVDDSGHGSMSLVYGNGLAADYQFAIAVGGYISIIQNGDGQATPYSAGLIKKQNSIPTDITTLKGAWAFGGYGLDVSNARYAASGTFTVSPDSSGGGGGTVTNGLRDENDNGNVTTGDAFNGSMTAPDADTGRGGISFGTGGVTSTAFAYYFVSINELILIDTNPPTNTNPLILYNSRKQVGIPPSGFSNALMSGPVASELTAVTSGTPDVSLGLVTFDGKGGYTSSIDDNNGGSLSQQTPSGTYSVDSVGRITFTGWTGGAEPIVHMTSFNTGYFLGTDAAVSYGEWEPQIVTGILNNSNFQGAYAGGSLALSVPTQTVEVDIDNADGATPGTLSVTYDTSGPGGPQQNLTAKATYSVAGTGRFELTDANNNRVGIGYIVGIFVPQRVVILTTGSQPVLNAIQK